MVPSALASRYIFYLGLEANRVGCIDSPQRPLAPRLQWHAIPEPISPSRLKLRVKGRGYRSQGARGDQPVVR